MGKVIKLLSGMLKFDSSISYFKKVFPHIKDGKWGMSEMLEKLKAHLESPEGKASMEKYFGNLLH